MWRHKRNFTFALNEAQRFKRASKKASASQQPQTWNEMESCEFISVGLSSVEAMLIVMLECLKFNFDDALFIVVAARWLPFYLLLTRNESPDQLDFRFNDHRREHKFELHWEFFRWGFLFINSCCEWSESFRFMLHTK